MSKPIVEVISPVGECSCSFSTWINKVWDILNEYRDRLEIVSLVSDSPRVEELGVAGRSIVVNGVVVPIFELEQKLIELLAFR
ncbi:MAG: hypothetical protein JSV04_03205 [Candidatus Heimdallarchaeota archaeon]|nr:MAG: hypothetical protein JSV04_03205 [Candidatus Heimdallarchaeota archaeon]